MKTGKAWRTAVAPEFTGHKGEVYADELRAMHVTARAKVFKARMDGYFKQQVGMFAPPNPTAHFPLVVMTCVGIETLGAYKHGDFHGKRGISGRKKVSDRHFQLFVEEMDAQFQELAGAPDGTHRPLSDFLYEGFRHSLMHGFYGKWVHITAEDTETDSWFYDSTEKTVVLNVFWFYRRFCKVYDEYFQALLACNDPAKAPLKTFGETFEMYFSAWI